MVHLGQVSARKMCARAKSLRKLEEIGSTTGVKQGFLGVLQIS